LKVELRINDGAHVIYCNDVAKVTIKRKVENLGNVEFTEIISDLKAKSKGISIIKLDGLGETLDFIRKSKKVEQT